MGMYVIKLLVLG